jgi:hypothetical protein
MYLLQQTEMLLQSRSKVLKTAGVYLSDVPTLCEAIELIPSRGSILCLPAQDRFGRSC